MEIESSTLMNWDHSLAGVIDGELSFESRGKDRVIVRDESGDLLLLSRKSARDEVRSSILVIERDVSLRGKA